MPPLPTTRLPRLKVGEIRRLLESAEPDGAVIERLSRDPRAGVQALARSLVSGRERKRRLDVRMEDLRAFECSLRREGYHRIAGVDEAGRGPLAGPVAVGCVVLPENARLPGLDDSKRMTPKSRVAMERRIIETAEAWSVILVGHVEIDELGILGAVLEGMRGSVERLAVRPDFALVDGNVDPGLSCRSRTVVGGDARCMSVAAASVLAKCARDRFMVGMDERYPGYGFARHKGYGCQAHINAIRRLGPCGIHRFSFHTVIEEAPEGTVRAAIETRLRGAETPAELERAAHGIRRVDARIGEHDLARLREVYRECRQRFS